MFPQIHTNLDHPDKPLLEHAQELIQQLDAAGIKPSPLEEDGDGNDEGEWEDEEIRADDGRRMLPLLAEMVTGGPVTHARQAHPTLRSRPSKGLDFST